MDACKLSQPKDTAILNYKSTWPQRAWVAIGSTIIAISLAKSTNGGGGAAESSRIWLPVLAGLMGYISADLISGIYHWALDNYGDVSTPVVGTQIVDFLAHHEQPWTITKLEFARNTYVPAKIVTCIVLPIILLIHNPIVHAFVALCFGWIMISVQIHAWSHGIDGSLPPLVVMLQEGGVILSRSNHAAHHQAPYKNSYCVISGIWNEFLNRHRVFESFEKLIFLTLGVKPRSWDEPKPSSVYNTKLD